MIQKVTFILLAIVQLVNKLQAVLLHENNNYYDKLYFFYKKKDSFCMGVIFMGTLSSRPCILLYTVVRVPGKKLLLTDENPP